MENKPVKQTPFEVQISDEDGFGRKLAKRRLEVSIDGSGRVDLDAITRAAKRLVMAEHDKIGPNLFGENPLEIYQATFSTEVSHVVCNIVSHALAGEIDTQRAKLLQQAFNMLCWSEESWKSISEFLDQNYHKDMR